jgi:3'(2'), 5'-bisphosphate nucleotidase
MSTALTHLAALLPEVVALVRAASVEVMDVYANDASARSKGDGSPVTAADERAEAVICRGLRALTPELPVIAEEAVHAGHVPAITGGTFWLVDPLDGTKEFVSHNGEFTVNVALVHQGAPVLGGVDAPAIGLLWAGATGVPAYREDATGVRCAVSCRDVPAEGLTVMGSRSHGDAAALDQLLAGHRVARLLAAGSSLKLCRLAEGSADLYPRLGRTMEWDIAAGHAVLLAAGGGVSALDGVPLRYGKAGFENPHFVAFGRPWQSTLS